MQACYHCKNVLEISGAAGRTETCPFCDADLHCCLNCEFHDPGAYNACRESQADRVVDKDRSNFCDCFTFKEAPGSKNTAGAAAKKKVNPLDSLFKK